MCLAIPGHIVEIVDTEKNLATADFNGVRREINITCVVSDDRPASACVGDWVLVHVGFAMSRIDEAEAAATLEVLDQLAEVQEEMLSMQASGQKGGP